MISQQKLNRCRQCRAELWQLCGISHFCAFMFGTEGVLIINLDCMSQRLFSPASECHINLRGSFGVGFAVCVENYNRLMNRCIYHFLEHLNCCEECKEEHKTLRTHGIFQTKALQLSFNFLSGTFQYS